jgi:hypothetical protein
MGLDFDAQVSSVSSEPLFVSSPATLRDRGGTFEIAASVTFCALGPCSVVLISWHEPLLVFTSSIGVEILLVKHPPCLSCVQGTYVRINV